MIPKLFGGNTGALALGLSALWHPLAWLMLPFKFIAGLAEFAFLLFLLAVFAGFVWFVRWVYRLFFPIRKGVLTC